MFQTIFNRCKTTVKNISYRVTKTKYPDGSVKEERILNHGGSAETPEQIKEVEQRMTRAMKNLDSAMETLNSIFKDI